MPRKKGSGRTKGAVSFMVVHLSELNRILKEDASVIVSRRYAEQVGLQGKPMVASSKNIQAHGERVGIKVSDLDETVAVVATDW